MQSSSAIRPGLRPGAVGAAVALFAALLDQAHKYWMLEVFGVAERQPLRLTPFLDVMLSWNHGVSYSLFTANGEGARIALIVGQAAISAGLAYWMVRSRRRSLAVALGLVVGGALGNLTDRVFRGAVADFFYLHTELPVGPLANYVFNVADVAITLGVALLLVDSFHADAERE